MARLLKNVIEQLLMDLLPMLPTDIVAIIIDYNRYDWKSAFDRVMTESVAVFVRFWYERWLYGASHEYIQKLIQRANYGHYDGSRLGGDV